MPHPDTMNETLPILYQDADMVVVHKPSGLLVHRSPIDRHETRFALQLVRDQLGCRVYSAHRLDKGTSGLLVFGLHPDAGRSLSMAFATQSVHKTYHAIVRGWPADEGLIDHPLSRQEDQQGHAAHANAAPDTLAPPQPAQTAFRTLATVTLPWVASPIIGWLMCLRWRRNWWRLLHWMCRTP